MGAQPAPTQTPRQAVIASVAKQSPALVKDCLIRVSRAYHSPRGCFVVLSSSSQRRRGLFSEELASPKRSV